MNPDEIKLRDLLQIDEAAGTIFFKNQRVLVLDADSIGWLRKELIGWVRAVAHSLPVEAPKPPET